MQKNKTSRCGEFGRCVNVSGRYKWVNRYKKVDGKQKKVDRYKRSYSHLKHTLILILKNSILLYDLICTYNNQK